MNRPRQIKPLAVWAAVGWIVSLLLSLAGAETEERESLLGESVRSTIFSDWLALLTFALGTLCAGAALMLFVLAAFQEWREGLARGPEVGRDHYA